MSLHFHNSGLAVLETPLRVYFCPSTIVFSKSHSDFIAFHNSKLFKLLAYTAAITVMFMEESEGAKSLFCFSNC